MKKEVAQESLSLSLRLYNLIQLWENENILQWRDHALENFPTLLPYGESLFILSQIPEASPRNQTWTAYNHYKKEQPECGTDAIVYM